MKKIIPRLLREKLSTTFIYLIIIPILIGVIILTLWITFEVFHALFFITAATIPLLSKVNVLYLFLSGIIFLLSVIAVLLFLIYKNKT